VTVARSGGWRARAGTLRLRISVVAVVAVVAVLTAVGVGLVLAQRATLLRDLDENLARQADVVAARLHAGGDAGRADLLTDDVAVLVSGPEGDTVAGAPGLLHAIFRYGPTPARVAVATVPLAGPDGEARVLSRTVAGRTVWVAAPMDDVRDSTHALVRSLLLAVPVGAAVLAALVWWAVGRTLRPVEAIRSQVARVSEGNLGRRVPEPRTADEIARLAHTMNAMLDRLQASAERQRRFVADASHELRSPLARIRTQVEVDRAHPDSADPAATQEAVLAETARLQRLVDDLLLLARGDAGALDRASADPVDLDAVVEGEAAARRDPGRPRIDTRAVGPAQVRGSRRQLERAVGNLLDNAVRHGSGLVTVTVTEAGGSVVLGVADDGPGVPAGAEELVFERFTRLDDARAASDGGSGLGLAIARDVAVRHGGTLAVDAAHGPGARFVLTLPGDGVSGDAAPGRTCTT
jgi:signal transduction histidine kinase